MLKAEPSATRVRELLEANDARVSWINLGEVYYAEIHRVGSARARNAIERVDEAVRAEEPDPDLVLVAAEIKAGGRISYADCFAVATAERHQAPLVTGYPEILALDRPELELIDLR